MTVSTPIPFTPEWPEPDEQFLCPEMPQAPPLPLHEVLGPNLATWVDKAAKAKGAPPDYVFAALLSVAGATIGNTRWVSIWHGWSEPPVIWSMCIGLPSAGKSPAIDALQQPLRNAERRLRKAAQLEKSKWKEQNEHAKLVEAVWKEELKTAVKNSDTPPPRPPSAKADPAPHIPRLVVNDTTIEQLAIILQGQPRGTLQMRDELAGWIEGMQRYAGSSDRAFWIEAYGGRSYTVERVTRDPLTVERLSVCVLGGIQPDRMQTLLLKSDDDGLLSRFLPIWPVQAKTQRPGPWADEALMDNIVETLLSLEMHVDDEGDPRPVTVPFTEDARVLMDEFRETVRKWETESEGLMTSFIGKLPGLAARLALVLGFLDWAADSAPEPKEITVSELGRAAHLIEVYILPMAERAYAAASTPRPVRAARRLVSIIRDNGWTSFTSRKVMRSSINGLNNKASLDPVLSELEEHDCIRRIEVPQNPRGGRSELRYAVNPALLRGAP